MIDNRRRTRAVDGEVEVVQKPKVIEDYNTHMGGVDKCDQLVLYYGYAHRSRKWWKKVFFHLLDVSIVNANILYNMIAEKPLPQLDFRLSLVAGLLDGHKRPVDRRHIAPTTILPMRLSECGFPEPIPKDTPYGGRPQCEVCKAKEKKDHKHSTNVTFVKLLCMYTHVLKSTIPNYIMNTKNHAHTHQ